MVGILGGCAVFAALFAYLGVTIAQETPRRGDEVYLFYIVFSIGTAVACVFFFATTVFELVARRSRRRKLVLSEDNLIGPSDVGGKVFPDPVAPGTLVYDSRTVPTETMVPYSAIHATRIVETPKVKLEIQLADGQAIYICRDQMESDSAFLEFADALQQRLAAVT